MSFANVTAGPACAAARPGVASTRTPTTHARRWSRREPLFDPVLTMACSFSIVVLGDVRTPAPAAHKNKAAHNYICHRHAKWCPNLAASFRFCSIFI
jgi:hypothetical protein